jgi:hypothetical protein
MYTATDLHNRIYIFTLYTFSFACVETSSYRFYAILCSTDKVDILAGLSWNTEEWMCVLNNFSFEKLHSPLTTETGVVKRMLIAINMLTQSVS